MNVRIGKILTIIQVLAHVCGYNLKLDYAVGVLAARDLWLSVHG